VRAARGRLHGQLSFIDLAGSEKGCDTAENDRQVCPESHLLRCARLGTRRSNR